jgi:hypothetical protein
LEGVRLTGAVGRQESGASTVNKEHPEVAVAPFGDGPEAPGGTRGGFTGREAEIVGQAAARGKALDVTDGGHESGGREEELGVGNQGDPLLDTLGHLPDADLEEIEELQEAIHLKADLVGKREGVDPDTTVLAEEVGGGAGEVDLGQVGVDAVLDAGAHANEESIST